MQKNARKTDTIYTVKIVNKRPRNLLNEIQNVSINGKQVKTAKITQIFPWFPRFYGTKTTGNSQRRYSPHAWTVTFARWQCLPTDVSGCGQLAGGLKVGRRYKCVSIYRVGQIKWHHFTFLLVFANACISKILWFLAQINYIKQQTRWC